MHRLPSTGLKTADDPPGAFGGREPGRAEGQVLAWLAEVGPLLACSGVSTTWSVRTDTDGSLLLLPSSGRVPGFAIMGTVSDKIEVLIAQPWRSLELGPFETLAAALHAIAAWLATPAGNA